jgi:hypothetical protein
MKSKLSIGITLILIPTAIEITWLIIWNYYTKLSVQEKQEVYKDLFHISTSNQGFLFGIIQIFFCLTGLWFLNEHIKGLDKNKLLPIGIMLYGCFLLAILIIQNM